MDPAKLKQIADGVEAVARRFDAMEVSRKDANIYGREIKGEEPNKLRAEILKLRKELGAVDINKPGALAKYNEILSKIEKAESDFSKIYR